MKKKNLPKAAIEICKRAYLYRKEGFLEPRFSELYQDFCEATNWEDTDTDNFRVYVKAYGDVRPGNKTFGTVLDGSKVVIQYRAFLKSDTAKSDTQDFIEKHREEMMRQMYLRSGYGLQ